MGNRVSGSKAVGLAEAIQSIVDHLAENNLKEIVLVGHSCGGMIITGLADTVPDRVRRLVYWKCLRSQ
jgi:pimeloyl-ACP methyl ester carboxylesterase